MPDDLRQPFLRLCLVYRHVGTGVYTSTFGGEWQPMTAAASLKGVEPRVWRHVAGEESRGWGGVRPKLLPFLLGLWLEAAPQLIGVSTELGRVRRGCFSSNLGSTDVIKNTDPATEEAGDKREVQRLLPRSLPSCFTPQPPKHTTGSLGATSAFPHCPRGKRNQKYLMVPFATASGNQWDQYTE